MLSNSDGVRIRSLRITLIQHSATASELILEWGVGDARTELSRAGMGLFGRGQPARTSQGVCRSAVSRDLRSFDIRFELESDVPIRIRIESDESAAHATCRHTTNYAHSLFDKNINLCAVCS